MYQVNTVMINFKHVTFNYERNQPAILKNLEVEVAEGESVARMGANGCGKTTMAYLMAGIIPKLMNGELNGDISVFGQNLKKCKSLSDFSKDLAFLFQNPEDQFISFTVKDELTLAAPKKLELGFKILKSIKRFLDQYGALDLLHKTPDQMSMGEIQRVSIIAAAYQNPTLIILDEPTTALDYDGLILVTKILSNLPNTTKIINTHDLFWAKKTCKRIIGIMDGNIEFDLPSHKVDEQIYLSLFRQNNSTEKIEIFNELINYLEQKDNKRKTSTKIVAKSVRHSYFQSKKNIINDLSVEIAPGEILSVMGPNGSGKTTILMILSGLLKPKKGNVYFNNLSINKMRENDQIRVAVMLQNPAYQIITDSISQELNLSISQISGDTSFDNKFIQIAKKLLSLDDLKIDPQLLSFGWKKILCFISSLCLNPDVIIFDEPELGLDPLHRDIVAEVLRILANRNKTIIISCHDPYFMRNFDGGGLFIKNSNTEYYSKNEDMLNKHYSHTRQK